MAVWGGLAYPTGGGGAFGVDAKRNFHIRNGRFAYETRRNPDPAPKNSSVYVLSQFYDFPKNMKFPKPRLSKNCAKIINTFPKMPRFCTRIHTRRRNA